MHAFDFLSSYVDDMTKDWTASDGGLTHAALDTRNDARALGNRLVWDPDYDPGHDDDAGWPAVVIQAWDAWMTR